MKLSMWMIANRLAPLLDITTEISQDARARLNSARLVYATNCVHIYQENDAVVCADEEDRIMMYGVTLKEGFEIIQGVFDYFQDWEEMLRQRLDQRNYQGMLDECEILFQNPMIIMDANNKVLAMTRDVEEQDMDEEWRYLKKYGYSSLDSVFSMSYLTTTDRYQNGFESYRFKSRQSMQFDGLSYSLEFDDVPCGRITILKKERDVNPGDYQLVEKIASFITPVLRVSSFMEGEVRPNAFYDLIFHGHKNNEELQKQMQYNHWSEADSYQLVVLQAEAAGNVSQNMKLVQATISRQMPHSVVILKASQVILLKNRILSEDKVFLELVERIGGKGHLKVGFSLPEIGVQKAATQYEQAVNAIKYGSLVKPEEQSYSFFDYGVNYLLDAQYLADKINACHPVIRRLWKMKKESEDGLFDTLKVYLDNERSLNKTAAMLYTHRNTVLYRIKKCQEMLGNDLENAEIRYYIRISMHYLEETSSF